jgi:hypothetical protein
LLAYVEHFLVPTLRRNNIVVMDNFQAHMVPGIPEAIEKAHATRRSTRPTSIPSSCPTTNQSIAAPSCCADWVSTEPFARSCYGSVLKNALYFRHAGYASI